MGWRADGGLWLLVRGGGLYLSNGTGLTKEFEEVPVQSQGFGILDVGVSITGIERKHKKKRRKLEEEESKKRIKLEIRATLEHKGTVQTWPHQGRGKLTIELGMSMVKTWCANKQG
ncbi:hypothetical protein PIB30_073571 [Stylosanthes scabra]|uniref:Uncharacterized protein n=1 Tax=Stylosanthes scabra TaxID=79078 RepID=A0ABU6VNX9_9FABA|nr:hypothetical protein [Stylosanthes scabra]